MVIRSIETKKQKLLCFDFKKDIGKKKKTLLLWILQDILENQAFQRIAKFMEMKDIVILVKVDEMYNILKSLLATGCWSRQNVELDDQSFCSSLPFNGHTFTTPLLW